MLQLAIDAKLNLDYLKMDSNGNIEVFWKINIHHKDYWVPTKECKNIVHLTSDEEKEIKRTLEAAIERSRKGAINLCGLFEKRKEEKIALENKRAKILKHRDDCDFYDNKPCTCKFDGTWETF